jgi:hypothetical protein
MQQPQRLRAAPAPEGVPQIEAKPVQPSQGGLRIVTGGAILQPAPQATLAPETLQPAESSPSKSLFSRLRSMLKSVDGRTFDNSRGGMTLQPGDIGTPSDIRLDSRPGQPWDTESPRLAWNRIHLPGARKTLLQRMFGRSSLQPVELPGDPQDALGVKEALLDLIKRNPAEFGGLSVDSLRTVVAQKVAGQEGLTDTVYVTFQQTLSGLPVEGTHLSFTVKLIAGKAMLVASSVQVYPKLTVDAFGRLSDGEILEKAFERLGRPTGSVSDLKPIGRRIMHMDGRWRSLHLLMSESTSLIGAVDVETGEAFAWDARMPAAAGGSVAGRGVEFDPVHTGANLATMPLPNTEVTASDGRKVYTDKDGTFTIEGSVSDAPVTVTAKLKGKYAVVADQERKDLVVTAAVKPGEKAQLLFNPAGVDENSVAQVNAYRHVNAVHDWLVARGVDVSSIHKEIPIKVNINKDCNAYYTPWMPSLNFFRSSSRCINTAYDTVVYHEYGHFVDDMIGGIANGGLSEGWGDILSLFITRQNILGEGFLKNPPEGKPDYIRNGDNDYQYKASDEVHKQGQAWMGFAWRLRKALIAAAAANGLSPEEAQRKGEALVESLVIPVLLANVRDIPAAIEAVLLRDIGPDGHAAHFKEIESAAKAHGITVREPKPGQLTSSMARPFSAGWLAWLARWLAMHLLPRWTATA